MQIDWNEPVYILRLQDAAETPTVDDFEQKGELWAHAVEAFGLLWGTMLFNPSGAYSVCIKSSGAILTHAEVQASWASFKEHIDQKGQFGRGIGY